MGVGWWGWLPAELAALSVLYVHGAVLLLLAGEQLIVLGLDGATEECAAGCTHLAAVVGVTSGPLTAHLAEVFSLQKRDVMSRSRHLGPA